MSTPVLFTTEQAASYLNISPSSLIAARGRGEGPAYVKMGKSVRYSLEVLDAFVESKTVLTDDAVNNREQKTSEGDN